MKLGHLVDGMNGIQRNLDEADSVKSNMDSMLEQRFSDINKTIEASLKDLVRGAKEGQTAAFSGAVQQAMLQLTQTQQILLNSLDRISGDNRGYKDEICADLDKLSKEHTKSSSSITKQINDTSAEINKNIKALPKPPIKELGAISEKIDGVSKQIDAIPVPKKK